MIGDRMMKERKKGWEGRRCWRGDRGRAKSVFENNMMREEGRELAGGRWTSRGEGLVLHSLIRQASNSEWALLLAA